MEQPILDRASQAAETPLTSHRRRWEDVDDMGGVVKPLDEALAFIATTDIFWLWT